MLGGLLVCEQSYRVDTHTHTHTHIHKHTELPITVQPEAVICPFDKRLAEEQATANLQ